MGAPDASCDVTGLHAGSLKLLKFSVMLGRLNEQNLIQVPVNWTVECMFIYKIIDG